MELIIQIRAGYFTGVAPGTYNVTVQNAAGCISTATVATINGAPTAPAAPTVKQQILQLAAMLQERSQ
jgi:hypothetical protein